ncbi:MAG: hypothetical protein ACK4V1_01395 [Burkholderiaceae bacterium]
MQAPINFVISVHADAAREDGAIALGLATERLRASGADLIETTDDEATLVQFDAPAYDVLWRAAELAREHAGAGLRFGIASGVKERPAGPGTHAPRASERSVAQARGLARSAERAGVLVSSQLGSLLIVSDPTLAPRLRATRLFHADGGTLQAYRFEAGAG